MSGGVSSFGGSDPDSVANAGSVTAPLAGANVTSIAAGSLPAGVYDVVVTYFLSATAETALANVRIRKGVTTIFGGLPSITGAAPVTVRMPRVALDGTLALAVQASAAAAAGSQYSAAIVATRVA
jgi:hypothetical protein